MTSPLVYNLHGHEQIAQALVARLGAQSGKLERRDFPDGESYLRVHDDVAGRDVVILCGLEHPNPRFLPLSFLAATVREFGARRVGLVAPYLAYMRQDIRFHDGEALTSRCFALCYPISSTGWRRSIRTCTVTTPLVIFMPYLRGFSMRQI